MYKMPPGFNFVTFDAIKALGLIWVGFYHTSKFRVICTIICDLVCITYLSLLDYDCCYYLWLVLLRMGARGIVQCNMSS